MIWSKIWDDYSNPNHNLDPTLNPLANPVPNPTLILILIQSQTLILLHLNPNLHQEIGGANTGFEFVLALVNKATESVPKIVEGLSSLFTFLINKNSLTATDVENG